MFYVKKIRYFILFSFLFSLFFINCSKDISLNELEETENAVEPKIINTSPLHNLIPKTGNTYSEATLFCKAEPSQENQTITYQWFTGTPENGTPIAGANSESFTAFPPAEKGIFYYHCKITGIIQNNNSGATDTSETNCIFSVAYTGLPLVSITTPDNSEITSKEEWLEDATISISGAKNESWNFEPVKTSIHGRGNSTWVQPKKPYALKLDKKQKILGMQKHKRWVLIANYLDNSFIRNSMAFYLIGLFGLDYTVKGEFVDLVLNCEYKGLYWLGEAIKIDENRININDGNNTMTNIDDKDYLIEMDVYYDEPAKFKSKIRNLPYMIKK